MPKHIGLFLILTACFLTAIPLACQKNYSVSPPPGPTPTPTCYAPPQTPPCTNGIMWGFAQLISTVSNGITTGYAELLLTVDCGTYTTAGVTLTGPGMNLELPYGNGYISMNGTNYSDYITANNILFTTGAAYTLTSVTTSGTASASLVMPPTPSIATDGSTVTWPGNPVFSVFAVMDSSSNLTYESSVCWSAKSPASVPAPAFPSPGTYTVIGACINYTTSITGGHGIYYLGAEDLVTVVK